LKLEEQQVDGLSAGMVEVGILAVVGLLAWTGLAGRSFAGLVGDGEQIVVVAGIVVVVAGIVVAVAVAGIVVVETVVVAAEVAF